MPPSGKPLTALAQGHVLGYTARPAIVSIDFNHDPMSSSVFAHGPDQGDGRQSWFRILTWYDNEWGFSNRMLDTAAEMGKHL